jgi:zinc protease
MEVAMKSRFGIQSLCAALLLISMCFSPAGQAPSSKAPAELSYRQYAKSYEEAGAIRKVVFVNGVTVLVKECGRRPVVSIQAYVRAGFSDEPSKRHGIARLLAAMVNRGTGDRSIGTIRQNVQLLGGDFRASVNYENAQFEIVVPSAQWKQALGIQADALLNPALDKDEVKVEAGLIACEARGKLNDLSELASEKLIELGFNQPRMGKYDALAGSPLLDLAREDLVEFHKSRYAADEILLVVSGDINWVEVLNEIARRYGKLSTTGAKHASFALESEQKELRYRAFHGAVSVPRILFGFHTAAANDNDYRAMEVLSAILGLGEGSILNARLRDQKRLILGQETKLLTYGNDGYLSIQMEVNPKNIDRSEIALMTELELMKREEPDQVEMERALSQLENAYWNQIATVSGSAEMLARFELQGKWKEMDRSISDLRRVKPSDIKRVAGRYFQLQNCSVLEFLPVSGEERNLTGEAIRKTMEALLPASTQQELSERSTEAVYAIFLPSEDTDFRFNEIQYPLQMASILRGPQVYIQEDHTSPLIDIGIFFPGGKSGEKRDNAGITELMVNLMVRGTKEGMSAQFNRQIEIYGGRVRPVVEDDYFGFYFSILSRNIAPGLDLLQSAMKTPDFSKDAVSRQKSVQSARIQYQRDYETFPLGVINQTLFGDFSYSIDRQGIDRSVAEITLESLQRWHETYVKNRKPVVVAIGDTKGASLASYFIKNFSGSRMLDARIPPEYAKPLGKGLSIEETWNRNESMILIGFQAPPEDDEDVHAAWAIQGYAGGIGRFSQEIRDRLGAAYGASLTYNPRLRGGSMIASIAVRPGDEEPALNYLLEEIKRMTDRPIAYRDFRSAINEAVGAYEIRNQTRSEQIAGLAKSVLAGKGAERYQNFPKSLQEVNVEDLKEVAQKIFAMDKAVILRVYGKPQ